MNQTVEKQVQVLETKLSLVVFEFLSNVLANV